MVTTRGLVVRDPGSHEFFGVPWSNFSVDDHLRQHSRHAMITLWINEKRPVELAIDRRVAVNIANIAPVLAANPSAIVDEVVVATPEPVYEEAVIAPTPVYEEPLHQPEMAATPSDVGMGGWQPTFYDDPVIVADPAPIDAPAMFDEPIIVDEPLILDDIAGGAPILAHGVGDYYESNGLPETSFSEMPTAPVPIVDEEEDQYREATVDHPVSNAATAGGADMDRKKVAITAVAAFALLAIAALVGNISSRYLGDDAGVARPLTSESVVLD